MPGHQLSYPLAPGLLPPAGGVGFGHDVDLGPVGGQQFRHGRFQARVGDQRDRMPVDHAGQGEPQAEGAAGGLDDAGAGQQVAAGAGPFDHVQARPVLDATGIEALQLGPEAVALGGEGLGHAQERGVADEPGQGGAAGGRGGPCGRRGHVPRLSFVDG